MVLRVRDINSFNLDLKKEMQNFSKKVQHNIFMSKIIHYGGNINYGKKVNRNR